MPHVFRKMYPIMKNKSNKGHFYYSACSAQDPSKNLQPYFKSQTFQLQVQKGSNYYCLFRLPIHLLTYTNTTEVCGQLKKCG